MRESEEYEVGQQQGARLEPSTTPADDIPLTIARAPEGRLSALQQHHFCY